MVSHVRVTMSLSATKNFVTSLWISLKLGSNIMSCRLLCICNF